ncbi:uncharacterized protein [Ptychodera flava]|uniref:uncharacterized protein n=1 Tax=Ptychodera flava TaxID=63121 RepID=UPI003969C6D7
MYENGAKGGQLDDFETPDDSDESLATKDMMVYFKDLATSIDENDTIDLYYLEKLLHRGADINAGDKYGQTVFHEVARCWHTDVAKFMIENGAKVNQGDNRDRRPLHVAAAVNYPEMVSFLLDSGAEIEAVADGNGFTAITCAAANDACDALTVLYQRGADIHQKDPKGRTPLMVAALGDRSETCKLLLSLGAKADLIDHNGEPCIVTMLSKMPAVAGAALNQFHRVDGANRAQYYDLHYLEPQKPGEEKMRTRMPMEVVVHYRQFDNIDHEVFRELLDVKWQRFGKRAAIIDFCIDLIYILLWTALAVIKPDGRGCYYFPGDVWRVILWALAISYTVFLIIQELMEYFVSKSEFNEWKEWKRSIIADDMKYCHPKWPHEKIWLDRELEETNNVKASYFHDYWNIFDWCVYILLVFCVIFHLIDIGVVSDELCWPEDDVNATADGDLSAKINSGIRISEDEGDEDLESVASMIHIRLFAITIIFVWIRLLKPTRAFMTLGNTEIAAI